MKKLKNISLFLIVFLTVVGLKNTEVKAFDVEQWSPDARVPGYLNDTFTPFLVTDRDRTVHAFASQWIKDESRRLAIVYRKWSLSGGWTRPVDIILAPTGDAQIVGAYLDSSDRIHIIFITSEARSAAIYYSFAHAANADLAGAWSLPVIVGENIGLDSAAILGDDQDNLFIIYGGDSDGNGVYFVTSANAGMDWSKPYPVFLTNDTSLVPFSLQLVMGSDLQVRATWNVVTSLGVDEALYFANYSIPDSKWNNIIELDSRINLPDYFGPSFPAIVDNGKEIVIMYNGGNPFFGRPVNQGRPIQLAHLSIDGGQTWSGPLDPFPLHLGRSGEHALVLDGKGLPHTLFVQRIETINNNGDYSIVSGIWHSTFQENAWSTPDRIITTVAAHDVRAVVCQGNILLAVWREDPGAGKHGIWFSYKILDEPELPKVPLSTAPVPILARGGATEVPDLKTPTSLPESNLLDNSPSTGWRENPSLPIILGVVPVLLVLAGVLVGYRILNNRRN